MIEITVPTIVIFYFLLFLYITFWMIIYIKVIDPWVKKKINSYCDKKYGTKPYKEN